MDTSADRNRRHRRGRGAVVYELAKDLNVQPKDLLNKVRAMGIDVANHMSHLESVDVDRVRRAVDRERLENLEEVRLNDTVIRRRSKSAAGAAAAARRRRPPGRRRRRRRAARAARARAAVAAAPSPPKWLSAKPAVREPRSSNILRRTPKPVGAVRRARSAAAPPQPAAPPANVRRQRRARRATSA